jgi:hypothetical protein
MYQLQIYHQLLNLIASWVTPPVVELQHQEDTCLLKQQQQTTNNKQTTTPLSKPGQTDSYATRMASKVARFCHECGNPHTMPDIRFCCECGVKRLYC